MANLRTVIIFLVRASKIKHSHPILVQGGGQLISNSRANRNYNHRSLDQAAQRPPPPPHWNPDRDPLDRDRDLPPPAQNRSNAGGTHPIRMLSCYHPQTKFAKVMFSQVSVCPQGGSAPLHAQMHTPRQTPPAPLGRHPSLLGRHPSPEQCMLGYGQQAGGTHPTGMHSYLIFMLISGPQHRRC